MSRMTGTTRRARQAQPMPSCSPRALARRLAALPDFFTSRPVVTELIDQLSQDRRARRYWRAEMAQADGYLSGVFREVVGTLACWRDGQLTLAHSDADRVILFAIQLGSALELRTRDRQYHVARRARHRYERRGRVAPYIGTSDQQATADHWLNVLSECVDADLLEEVFDRCALSHQIDSLLSSDGFMRHYPKGRGLAVQVRNNRLRRAVRTWVTFLWVRLRASEYRLPVAPPGSPWLFDLSASESDDWPPPWRPVLEVLTCAVLTAAPPARVPVPVGEGQCARLTVAA